MKKYLLILFTLTILFFGSYSVSAQQKDDQCLKALELTTIDLQKEKIKSTSLEEQIKIKDDYIATLNKHIETLKSIVDNLTKQLSNSGQIDTNSKLITENLRTQVSELKDELKETRRERDKARKDSNVKAIIAFGAGAATGALVKN